MFDEQLELANTCSVSREIYFLRTVRVTHTGDTVWSVMGRGGDWRIFCSSRFRWSRPRKRKSRAHSLHHAVSGPTVRGRGSAFCRKDNLIIVARVSNIVIYGSFLGFRVTTGNARDSIRRTIIFIHVCTFDGKNENVFVGNRPNKIRALLSFRTPRAFRRFFVKDT